MRKDTYEERRLVEELLTGERVTKIIMEVPIDPISFPEISCRILEMSHRLTGEKSEYVATIEVTVNENPAIKRIGEFIR